MRLIKQLVLLLACVQLLQACDSDVNPRPSAGGAVTSGTPPVNTGGANGAFALQLSSGSLGIVEGAQQVRFTVSVSRNSDFSGTVNLAAEGRTPGDENNLNWSFSDSQIQSGESSSVVTLNLNIGTSPIKSHNRILRIVGTDGSNAPAVAEIGLQVTPTSRPDVYLLAGQSNMVGFSEANAKRTGPGQADEPNARILQLNVTGNDDQNFPDENAFSNPARVAVDAPRFTLATDPLHDGFDARISGKEGSYIGMALSFAKRAQADTTADIYLVPAAWANTGFCMRDNGPLTALGWHATTPADTDNFSGTLLHDRAIARTNIALQETGGILRGILWHQGEADSDELVCAQAYQQNLQNMVASLRSNIVADARGPGARGPNAGIPFIAGTMSQGADERGAFTPFIEAKQLVDSVHRNIASHIALSATVNNDDLVPPAYACGEGSCIHFGAAAYREMGARYYNKLRDLANP